MKRGFAVVGLIIVAAQFAACQSVSTVDPIADADRYRATVALLADPSMEGRGPTTEGLVRARDYIADGFKTMGLEPAFDGSYKQALDIPFGRKRSVQRLSLSSGDATYLAKVDEEFAASTVSGTGAFEGEVIFAGYGVSNAAQKRDSYADADVKGKVVVVFRYEPHDASGRSRWVNAQRPAGSWSSAAALNRKAELAAKAGAAGLIIVNPPAHNDAGLPGPNASPQPNRRNMPVFQATAQWLAGVLERSASHADVTPAELAERFNKSAAPAEPIAGVTLSGRVKIEADARTVHNVAAVLPGSGSLADEVVIVGAHYDHVGRGNFGSRAGARGKIHPGADDNASGTSGMLLLAHRYARRVAAGELPRDRRTMMLVAFAAEERGLLGSRYFADHLEEAGLDAVRVAFMINLDMIGRLTNNKLTIGGRGSGEGLGDWFETLAAQTDFEFAYMDSGFGPSDHASFYARKIPVLFFFTGLHVDYHAPGDTVDKVNYEGALRIIDLVDTALTQLVGEPERIAYAEPAGGGGGFGWMLGRGGGSGRPLLGVSFDPANANGVAVQGVAPGGPAQKAGLRSGDTITHLAGESVADMQALVTVLNRFKPGQVLRVTVERSGETKEIRVKLGSR